MKCQRRSLAAIGVTYLAPAQVQNARSVAAVLLNGFCLKDRRIETHALALPASSIFLQFMSLTVFFRREHRPDSHYIVLASCSQMSSIL